MSDERKIQEGRPMSDVCAAWGTCSLPRNHDGPCVPADPVQSDTPPPELRSLDYCMGHKERHIIGHGSTEHHEGTPCEACDYLDAAQETRALFEVQYRRMAEAKPVGSVGAGEASPFVNRGEDEL